MSAVGEAPWPFFTVACPPSWLRLERLHVEVFKYSRLALAVLSYSELRAHDKLPCGYRRQQASLVCSWGIFVSHRVTQFLCASPSPLFSFIWVLGLPLQALYLRATIFFFFSWPVYPHRQQVNIRTPEKSCHQWEAIYLSSFLLRTIE